VSPEQAEASDDPNGEDPEQVLFIHDSGGEQCGNIVNTPMSRMHTPDCEWSEMEVDSVLAAIANPNVGRTYIDIWCCNHVIRAFVDPGSDTNFVSTKFYRENLNHYPLKTCTCKVMGFGDNAIAFEGYVDIPVSLGGMSTQVHRFKVYNKMPYVALLGDRLMRSFEVKMNFKPGERMIVEGVEIPTFNWDFEKHNFVETQDCAAKIRKGVNIDPETGDWLELSVNPANFR
jgi:hypothetical protein